MNDVGKPERVTQERVLSLFQNELGFDYLGNRTEREGNSNIEEEGLTKYLTQSGCSPQQISAAIGQLQTAAQHPTQTLYQKNQAVYQLLRYGAQVKTEASSPTDTIAFIDWKNAEANHFSVAEEVTLLGNQTRRPDVVLYVNGIAIGVLELKRSSVGIGEGIRQNLSNQKPEFHEWFFSTIQFVFAGNDTEGLRYGTIGTPEKYFLTWKEDEETNVRYKLDKYLLKMCQKERLIELMRDFVLFDAGVKKLPRVHQYFGIKAAQTHVEEQKSGIIWHTQGSGKSIVMVMLAKWILENHPNARVAIMTDRNELDEQIERVFTGVGETIYRTISGRDLMGKLGQAAPRLLCSLVHKFGRRDVDDFDAFIKEVESQPTPTVGDVFVFVDECHRTQGGKLHQVMKAMMPEATFIGFTGTPLLKKDKETSLEVFGGYIHTYKFSEGVEDGVILDLVYESRDIEQEMGSQEKIDAWFEAKTRGLNDWQKEELSRKWGTMRQVLSSRSRMERIVEDIVFDFSVKPRISDERGNALLVVSSIYEASKYYEILQKTPFRGKCGIVTSYAPYAGHVSREEVGANTESDKQFVFNTYTELLASVQAQPNMSEAETYEHRVKKQFVEEPANMKLLVVVAKLLTGFDAPSCTYLYLDKSMEDHGLFQAICRVNRLDDESKTFGYIVDFKDLFKKVENAIAVYSTELDHSAPGASPEVLIKDRVTQGKERLLEAREVFLLLCEPISQPKGELESIHYFCGNTEKPEDLKAREPQRVALYKSVATFVRAYANLSDQLSEAGFSTQEISAIKALSDRAVALREIIRHASGETLDTKAYEADMRHLIDTYIEASESRVISPFGDMSLLDLIVKSGIADAITSLPKSLQKSEDALAETIANNVRQKIIKEHLSDPAFYAKMSDLLGEVIDDLRAKRIAYEEYLVRIAALATNVQTGMSEKTPEQLSTSGRRALYNNLKENLDLALFIDETVKRVRLDSWRGNLPRERQIKAAILPLLANNTDEVERIFLILKEQAEY